MHLIRFFGIAVVASLLFSLEVIAQSGTTTAAPPAQRPATPAAQADPHAGHDHSREAEAEANLPPAPVTIDPPTLELGMLKPGQRGAGEVQLRNLSDKPLKIVASRASCTCTSVNLRNVVIQPGGSVPVPARFNGKTGVGEVKESIRISIEGFAMVEVPVRGFIDAPIQAVPPYIDGLSASKGEITVIANNSKPFRILAVNGAAPDYVDFNPATDEPQTKYLIRWDLSGYDSRTCSNAAGQRMPGWFLVETDNPDVSVLDVEVRHQCTRRFKPPQGQSWLLAQKSVMLGQVKATQPAECIVTMTWMKDAVPNDTIVAVESESPDVDVQLLGVEGDSGLIEAKIRVTPKGSHRGALYAPIKVKSSRHYYPVVLLGQIVD